MNEKFLIDGKAPCKCPIVGKDRQCAKWYPSGKNVLDEYHQFCRAETGFDDWPRGHGSWQTSGARSEELRKGYADRRNGRDQTDWGSVWTIMFILALLATIVYIWATRR